MNRSFKLGDSKPAAFTLIEVLVATAVLAMMVAFVAQIISMSSNSIANASRKLDSVSESRLVLDRIGADLASRLKRDDVGVTFTKSVGNDGFAFLSEVSGYNGARGVSVIEYRIPGADTNHAFQLERGATGTSWTGGTTVNFSSTLPPPNATDYDLLGPGVLRLETAFVKTDGTIVKDPPVNFSEIASLIVAMAVVDPTNRKLATENQLAVLSSALADTVDGSDPLTAWQAMVDSGQLPETVPSPVRKALRFSQRYYEIR